jgi:hypothetical protein
MIAERTRWRLWLEAGATILAVLFTLVTIAMPAWLEFLFGLDPDNGEGWVEFGVTLALGGVALISATLAVRDYRRRRLLLPD